MSSREMPLRSLIMAIVALGMMMRARGELSILKAEFMLGKSFRNCGEILNTSCKRVLAESYIVEFSFVAGVSSEVEF